MSEHYNRIRQLLLVAVVASMLGCAQRAAAVALPNFEGGRSPLSGGRITTVAELPDVPKLIHRVAMRTEHSATRFVRLLGTVGLVWVWLIGSVVAFFAIAAVSSVVDLRMLDFRHEKRGAASRYFGHGIRTFFRIVADRETPNLARTLLAVALLYWLVPFDLLPDDPVLPGLVDDVVIAILAGKGFLYLCPDSLVENAARIEEEAHA